MAFPDSNSAALLRIVRARFGLRRWCVQTVESVEDLARQLAKGGLPLCAGFRVRNHSGHVFLNDSSVSDPNLFIVVKVPRGAGQEFSVLDSMDCDARLENNATEYLGTILAGAPKDRAQQRDRERGT